MKWLLEAVKVLTLVTIAGLLAMQTDWARPPVGIDDAPASDPTPPETVRETEEQVLLRLMDYMLRSPFKFPDAVRVERERIVSGNLLEEAGYWIDDPMEEIRLLAVCGHYAAPNAMNLYGKEEPFLGLAFVDHSEKEFGLKVWFMHDGSWRSIDDFDGFTSDLFKENGEKLWEANCGDLAKPDLAIFEEFTHFGVLAEIYFQSSKEKPSREDVDFANICQGGELGVRECASMLSCLKEASDEEEWGSVRCALVREVCGRDASFNDCARALRDMPAADVHGFRATIKAEIEKRRDSAADE